MSGLPYPETIRNQLLEESGINRSLLFNRSFSFYNEHWQIIKEDRRNDVKEGRLQFFESFIEKFKNTDPLPFKTFIKRRAWSLDSSNAVCVPMCSTSRLVIGLGLPHPTETNLLFDRLTGCPYLPGSSVKGMMHQAARLAGCGDLTVDGIDRSFWIHNVARIFGPNIGENGHLVKGEMIFYDAFPHEWPKLALDVLTPHYRKYYEDPSGKVVPGDWENPNPVRFLTIESGVIFDFHFQGLNPDLPLRRKDEDAIQALLPIALDWLGIGGKKSSGYGTFNVAAHPCVSLPEALPSPPKLDERTRTATTIVRPHKETDRLRQPSHSRRSKKAAPHSFPKPSKNSIVQETTTQEIVTLKTLPKADKALVTTAEKLDIPCKGIPIYPDPMIGGRLRAKVRRINGIAKDAHFKGWL